MMLCLHGLWYVDLATVQESSYTGDMDDTYCRPSYYVWQACLWVAHLSTQIVYITRDVFNGYITCLWSSKKSSWMQCMWLARRLLLYVMKRRKSTPWFAVFATARGPLLLQPSQQTHAMPVLRCTSTSLPKMYRPEQQLGPHCRYRCCLRHCQALRRARKPSRAVRTALKLRLPNTPILLLQTPGVENKASGSHILGLAALG